MLPDLESLRCFDVAATQLSFRQAAKVVALSPTAFSDRIRRLEEGLGKPLFVRTTRKVTLSPAGEALWPQARRVLEEAARCADAVRSESSAQSWELRLGTRFELGLSWILPALEAFRASHPERRISLQFGDSTDLLERVRNGLLDCVVTSARLTSAWSRYSALHRETYAFVSTRAQLKKRPLRRSEDAVAHRLIDLHPDLPLFRYLLDAQPLGQVWRFADQEHVGTIAAVRHRLLESAGVGVLPRYFVEPDLRRGRLVEVLPKLKLQQDAFRLVWREGNAKAPQLEVFAEELRAMPLR